MNWLPAHVSRYLQQTKLPQRDAVLLQFLGY